MGDAMPRKLIRAEESEIVAGKRYSIGFRTTFELRKALETAAMKSGRSLAQEIEHRLEQSLEADKRARRRPEPETSDVIRLIDELRAQIGRDVEQTIDRKLSNRGRK